MTEPNGLRDLLDLAERHGLQLDPARSRVDESGVDFRVVHATDAAGAAWILRVPRRPDVMARTDAELRALAFVRDRLPIRVPEWRIFSPELIAYPRVPGDPAAVIDMSAGGYVWRFDASAPPNSFLRSLGAALALLHGLPVAEAEAAGLPIRDSEALRAAYSERIGRAEGALSIPAAVRRRWVRWIESSESWPRTTVPVHGDLHPPHILVDDAGTVTGFLDWTEAHVGDPATDFAILYATMGAPILDRLLVEYARAGGAVDGWLREQVIETWAAYPLVIADFAIESGEAGPLQLAQGLIDSTAAAMAEAE